MNHFETAKALFFEGLRFLEADDFVSAEARLAQALELAPGRTSILNNQSAVKLRLEKFAEAEEIARQAVELDAQSPDAWANLGNALNAMQRHAEAVAAYDRALRCDANCFVAWLNKAVSLLALKSFDDALSASRVSALALLLITKFGGEIFSRAEGRAASSLKTKLK